MLEEAEKGVCPVLDRTVLAAKLAMCFRTSVYEGVSWRGGVPARRNAVRPSYFKQPAQKIVYRRNPLQPLTLYPRVRCSVRSAGGSPAFLRAGGFFGGSPAFMREEATLQRCGKEVRFNQSRLAAIFGDYPLL
jgi:hypothetical protein